MSVGLTRARNAVLRWSGALFLVREVLQRNRATIVFYHGVDPATLDAHLSVLARRYNFVSLGDYVDARVSGRTRDLPRKPMIVTLDDGLASHRSLLGVFESHGVTPTIFVCSGIVDTNRKIWTWSLDDRDAVERLKTVPDHVRVEELVARGVPEDFEYPERSTLDGTEIEEMRHRVDFQAHGVLHPILTRCTDERVKAEIQGCKADLEQRFGLDVFAIAYPNGSYSEREISIARESGYTCGLTTELGLNGPETDLFRLRRVHMPDSVSESAVLVTASVFFGMLKERLRGGG